MHTVSSGWLPAQADLRPWGAIVLASLLLCGCGRSSERDQETAAKTQEPAADEPAAPERALEPGHRKMLEALAQLAERVPDEHPYHGTRAARQLHERLANLPESTSSFDRWELQFLAGQTALDGGNPRVAIEHLSEAHRLVPSDQLDSPIGVYTRFRLGVAYMRLGETENCCQRHTSESCIVPIQGGGLHTKLEGSESAIRMFTQILSSADDPDLRTTTTWLLNIAYMTLGGYPDQVPEEYLVPTTVFESNVDFPRFRNVGPKLVPNTFNLSGGAIVDDFDGDGYLDIVTSTWDPTDQLHFFRNDRDGTFTDRTEQAGLRGLYGGLNIKQADYDNDGDLDIMVLRGAWMRRYGQQPNSLLRNNGDGTFTDVTFDAGLGEVHYPTQTAAWGDYDNDGDVDLYIGNETSTQVDRDLYSGEESSDTGLRAPCQLFRNNGDGTFTDVAAAAGVENNSYTKGVVWGDYDNDRFPDLYVSNLIGPNRLYRNNKDGTFTDVAPQLDVTRPTVGFPVWFWDFDNDGVVDLLACSYTGRINSVAAYYLGGSPEVEPACLYRGDGHGGFEDVTREQNLILPMLPMGSNFGDVNDDGYLDFYLGTGDPSYESLMPNLMFLNRGGEGFLDVTMAGGFGNLQKGHGVAFADLDNDGDTDVYQQMGGAFKGDEYYDSLYENPGFGHHWIGVRLVGVRSNRSAIGARIHVQIEEDGELRSIYRHVDSGGSFGANPLRQHIGIGKATRIRALEVFWPTTGRTQTFEDVAVDQTIRIVEGEDRYTRLELRTVHF
ncbi:MAG: FG-GAP-like repeat-containing protein [Candidatus Krumholzibacteriia bacterium]